MSNKMFIQISTKSPFVIVLELFYINLYVLAFSRAPTLGSCGLVWILSRDTQQLQMSPPLHKSKGFPPASTHEMLSPQSNLTLLYQHV